MNQITYNEYWKEVESITKNCFDSKMYNDTSEETWTERLHEQIDGHQWIICTAYHFQVLEHSDNDLHGEYEMLVDPEADFRALCQQMAFWAFYADCFEYFSRNRKEIING